ncbi:MAG TPA: multicopper oxidase domain-containing protein [Acidimicrobiia bacterium]|jgi:hypothetical protein|nr:multicopper oxidase domain-containing protein [Acidimicrobiia bacterium]
MGHFPVAGETEPRSGGWDAIVLADNPGTWAFHCHVLSHAEGPEGMFGMFSALHVD